MEASLPWGRLDEDGEELMSCTILTGPSPQPGSGGVLEDLAGLHDRIPLPISGDLMDAWLSAEKLDKEEASGLIDHIRGEANGIASGWEVYEVGQAVGNVRNNDASLVVPLESETPF